MSKLSVNFRETAAGIDLSYVEPEDQEVLFHEERFGWYEDPTEKWYYFLDEEAKEYYPHFDGSWEDIAWSTDMFSYWYDWEMMDMYSLEWLESLYEQE